MDLPLIMAALMNRWGEDILPEEVAYAMEDGSTHSTTGNTAFAAAAAGCCGYPCWQAWMDLADLRAQIHDGCSVAVQVERRIRGQRDPVRVWMGLRGFGHDDAVMADYVLLNDPTADSDGAVNCTMALVDFMRYFTGQSHCPAAKQREVEADRPRRLRCELHPAPSRAFIILSGAGEPADPCRRIFPAGSPARPTMAWRTPPPPTAASAGWSARRREASASRQKIMAAGCRYSVYAVDQTGTMRVAEVRLPKPKPAPASTEPQASGKAGE